MEDFHVNDEVVFKVINGLFRLQKIIIDPQRVKRTLLKVRDWLHTFEGDDAEGGAAYLVNKMVEAFTMSKTTVSNEFDRDSLQEYNKLSYLEFMEFLVRIADLYFADSEMMELELD